MNLNRLLMLLIFLTAACGTKYKYWDVSKFNMNPNALQDGEEIKLLYSSRAPDNNEKLEYYIHVIVVSQKTGDTVNVLTTINNAFWLEDKDAIYNYLSPDNPVTKSMQMNMDSLRGISNIDELNAMQPKDIKKVARDPEFDYIADNKFPTVIGAIGMISKNDDK